jgi:protoheme IX farnesyltransferase
MLPVLEDSLKRTNRQILWHSALLIPISVLPSLLGISGSVYFLGAGIMSIGYMMAGLPLFQRDQLKRAKFLLKASVIYLPALFALIIIDLAY